MSALGSAADIAGAIELVCFVLILDFTDANGQSLAYVYSRESNIAKLPT